MPMWKSEENLGFLLALGSDRIVRLCGKRLSPLSHLPILPASFLLSGCDSNDVLILKLLEMFQVSSRALLLFFLLPFFPSRPSPPPSTSLPL